MDEKIVPIEHWSYSSLTLFLANRLAFKKKYILKIYDDTMSPSAIVGRMAHTALEELFKNGADESQAIQTGMEHLKTYLDGQIDYGKTGSREQIMKDYTKAIRMYLEEMPRYWDDYSILGCEINHTAFINYNGLEMALPAKAHIDLLVYNKKTKQMEIHDAKFKKAYTDKDERNWEYVVQAIFNYFVAIDYLTNDKLGQELAKDLGWDGTIHKMVFKECKISENKDKSQQVQDYEIIFDEHPEYISGVLKLYNDCTREIMKGDISFLPNPRDMFDGEDSMNVYMQDILSVDLSDIEVKHKTKVEKFVKKNFIQSVADKPENKHLSDEEKIREKLAEFGLPVEMDATYTGSSVILYTMKPSRGIRMKAFEQHDKDIALALKTSSVRVLAPIPGTDTVGIEVPNPKRENVPLKGKWKPNKGSLLIPIGVDPMGNVYQKDLSEMPHLLVAGSTGSGKSIFMNILIESITRQNTPSEVQLVLIDPKRVELSRWKKSGHLAAPVIYDDHKAAKALQWAVDEMERRYEILEDIGMRDIAEYNQHNPATGMQKIVIVIDEYADLMLMSAKSLRTEKKKESVKNTARKETAKVKARKAAEKGYTFDPDVSDIEDKTTPEEAIIRLAQKARAVGIHLVIATQRPSVDVIPGIIKANFPTRIAFRTTSATDSKIILDDVGAEELLGKGDMLLLDPYRKGLQRLQGFME